MQSKAAKSAVAVGVFVVSSLFIAPAHCFAAAGRELDPKAPVQISNNTTGVVDGLTVDQSGDRLAWVYQDRASADIYIAQLHYTVDSATGLNVDFDPVTNADRLMVTPGAAALSQIASDPSLNIDGTLLLFKSNMNLEGTNADNSPEVFYTTFSDSFLSAPTPFQQLTLDPNPAITPALTAPNPEGRLSSAAATFDGLQIVFSSKRDLVVGQNPSGIEQIFLYDKENDKYYQLTKTTNPSAHNLHPVIAGYGFTVAFISNDNAASVYQVYAVALPEKLFGLFCEGTMVDQDGVPDNECGSNLCIGDPRCPVEVCDDTNVPPLDEDNNGFANCQDFFNCIGDPACAVPNAPPTLTIVDKTNTPVGSSVTVDETKEVKLTVSVDDPDTTDFVQIRAYYDDGSGTLKPVSAVGAKLKYVSSSCDPSFEDCTCSANIETTDCLLTGPLTATYSWTPDTTRGGNNYSFVFKADDSDPTSAVSTQTVSVAVNNVNHAPTISPKPLGDKVIKFGQSVTIAISAADSTDKDALTLSGDVLPRGAQLVPISSSPGSAKAELRWTPTASDVNDVTPYPVTVSVSDGQATTTTQGTIKVVSNRPPAIFFTGVGITVTNSKTPGVPSRAVITEGKAFRIEVSLSDADGDTITGDINSQTMPAGSIYLAGSGVFSWLPGLNVAVSDTVPAVIPVTFTASDGTVQVTSTIEITVLNALDNDSSFVSLSTFVSTAPGGSVTLSATVKNTGVATWQGANYALMPDTVSAGLNPPASIPLAAAESILPGASKKFTYSFNAPAAKGLYTFKVRMSLQGQKFGTTSQTINVQVQ